MSLRNIKKLQSPDLIQHTDDSEESEATPRKAANNFELVSLFSATFSAKFSLRGSLVDERNRYLIALVIRIIPRIHQVRHPSEAIFHFDTFNLLQKCFCSAIR